MLPKCQPPRGFFSCPVVPQLADAADAELQGTGFYQRREGRRHIYRVFLDLAVVRLFPSVLTVTILDKAAA